MNEIKVHIILSIGLILAIIAGTVLSHVQLASGESFTGTISQIDSATTATVGPDGTDGGNAVAIYTVNSDCDARVITTTGTPIALVFGLFTDSNTTSSTLSHQTGHAQAASTTVVYDSGQFGCGTWYGYAGASTTVIISEF